MKKVVIWGCGTSGKISYEKAKSEFDVIAFIDNNHILYGDKMYGIGIISPETVYELCRDKKINLIILGGCSTNYDDIYNQINILHISN